MTIYTSADLAHLPFDPLHPVVLADPYPFYAWLRAHDPLHWGAPGEPGTDGTWIVTRYDDVMAMLKDERLGREIDRVLPDRNPQGLAPDAAAIVHEWMVLRDPPHHTLLRGLVHRAFTPQVIEQWTPRMGEIATDLVVAARERGRFDLLAEVAQPFPVVVVAELLGVPSEDAPLFTPWTQALAAVIEFEQTPAVRARGTAAMRDLRDYLLDVVAARRRAPEDDLISALLQQNADDPLSDDVLIGACTQLLFGGNDPVAHLAGNGLLALLRQPDQLAWLRDQPATPVTAVDELMRYDSSVQMTFRYALTDFVWADKQIRTGDLVALIFGAANRDAAAFDAPDRLDLTRSPNRHLSLGQGIHYCMGAALARTEGRVLFDMLLRELPTLHLDQPDVTWKPTVAVRGLSELWLRV